MKTCPNPNCRAPHPDSTKYCVCGYNFEAPQEADIFELLRKMRLTEKGLKNDIKS